MMQCYGQLKRHRLHSALAPGASAWKPAPSCPLHPWKMGKADVEILMRFVCGWGGSRHRFAHRSSAGSAFVLGVVGSRTPSSPPQWADREPGTPRVPLPGG